MGNYISLTGQKFDCFTLFLIAPVRKIGESQKKDNGW